MQASSLSHATLLVVGSGWFDWRVTGVSLFDASVIETVDMGGMAQVRQLIRQLQLRPQFGPIRLGVVYDFERLSHEAQSALLKLLEEPPESVKIILVARTEETVLPTVRSRCRVVRLNEQTARLSPEIFSSDALASFNECEALAKSPELHFYLARRLEQMYRRWIETGRSPSGVNQVEKMLELYHTCATNVNKRIALEHYVVENLWSTS